MSSTVSTGNDTGFPDGTKIADTANADGAKVQLVQLDILAGPGGVSSPVTALNPLPITGTLALPSGAATEAKQDTGNASLASIAAEDFATQATLAAVLAKIIAAPSTEAKQDAGNTSLASIDGKLPAQVSGRVPVDGSGVTQPVSNANLDVALSTLATSAKQPALVSGRVPVDPSGVTSPISAAALPLPSNAAAETGGNLASITTNTGRIPAQGQALAAASLPVVLTAAQVTTLTPPAAITGFALESTLGTMSAKLPATLGQKAMSASMAVVLASDQASVPVAATLTAETTKVIGTVNVAASQTIAITKTDLTPSSPTASSVGVTSAQVLAAAATRKGLVLVNTSNNRISLGFGAAAVLDSGITLYGPGGTFVMDDYCFDVGAVNAIASAAASNLAVQEYTT